jgi:hypothetical protein
MGYPGFDKGNSPLDWLGTKEYFLPQIVFWSPKEYLIQQLNLWRGKGIFKADESLFQIEFHF